MINPYNESKNDKIEHELMLGDLRAVIATNHGRRFIKYLFKHFSVGEVPPIGLDSDLTRDMMGFLRAGTSIFDCVAQADSIQAGLILAEVQKEKYDAIK